VRVRAEEGESARPRERAKRALGREGGRGGREKGRVRTYAHEEEQDAEDVRNGEEGEGEGDDDLAEGRDSAEETQDPKRAEDSEDAGVLARDEIGGDGHGDDEGVEVAPGVGEEGVGPVGQGVGEELGGEDDGEEKVEVVDEDGESGVATVGVGELVVVLGLDHGAGEVLRGTGWREGRGSVSPLQDRSDLKFAEEQHIIQMLPINAY
jgi:hypothetical protein